MTGFRCPQIEANYARETPDKASARRTGYLKLGRRNSQRHRLKCRTQLFNGIDVADMFTALHCNAPNVVTPCVRVVQGRCECFLIYRRENTIKCLCSLIRCSVRRKSVPKGGRTFFFQPNSSNRSPIKSAHVARFDLFRPLD